jgi:NAD(P)-dependent dehydrogenase (short-subunit alcohol dehydrogenase family)
VLRAGLLEGVSLLLAGAPPSDEPAASACGQAVAELCAGLGARVAHCQAHPQRAAGDAGSEAALDGAVAAALRELGAIDVLAVDAAALFADGLAASGGDGHAALRACVDGAWDATRATVAGAFLRVDEPRGRVVYLAPKPAGEESHAPHYAEAARAGLENLARTLSIEWARYAITAVAVTPGVATPTGEVATLVAYLASPAGAYFSGCQLDLRGAAAG